MHVEMIEEYIKPDDGASDYQWYDNHGILTRCKDCKQFYFADNRVPEEQTWICARSGEMMKQTDFCSRAVRRTK